MKKYNWIALFAVTLFAFSCKSDTKVSDSTSFDYNTMATELCACMQPVVDMNKKIQELSAAGKTEEVSDLFLELEKEFPKSEKCAMDLEAKYGAMDTPEQQEKATSAMERNCPEVAALINQATAVE